MDATMHGNWPGAIPGLRKPKERAFRWRLPHGLTTTVWMMAMLALFHWSGPLLRMADPTAAVVDIGAVSLVLLAVLALALFLTLAHWLLGLLWPELREYPKHHFPHNFKSLQPWQKITFYLVIFFGLLYAFVCCLVAVF